MEDMPLYDEHHSQKSINSLAVGDHIRIVYSGTIADLDPAIIDHVIFIQQIY